MTPILQAAFQGYGEDEILGYLSKVIPKLSSKIEKAQRYGYAPKKILGFLNDAYTSQSHPNLSPNKIEALNQQKYQQTAKKLLGTVASVAIPFAASRLASSRLLPSIMDFMGQNFQQGDTEQPPEQPQTPPVETAQQQPPDQPQENPQKSLEIFKNMGVISPLQGMLKTGTSPEDISAALDQHFMTPGQKKWLNEQIKSGQAKPLLEMVKDVASLQIPEENQKQAQKIQEPQEEVEPETLSKGWTIITPSGDLGELQASRNGKAIVSSNGKLHQVNEGDIIPSPLSKKDLATLYDELIKGMEEETGEERSRNVQWAGYDPDKNQFAYLPHNGSLYLYDNIEPEDVEKLKNVLATRSTTGTSLVGTWVKGTSSPIGHEMSNLIKKLQSQHGKGKEYSGKYKPVYSHLEPAYEAKKRKLAKERMDEKAEKLRIKKEKDEAARKNKKTRKKI